MSEADSKFADSLVSQDALDELMKEAEEQSPASIGADEESKDLDLVSPEDIEKLLETTSDSSGAEQEESDLDLISQDDIDSLISGEELIGSDAGETDDSDDSLISQDDIDALLSGTNLVEDSGKTTEDADDSLISQDDIDALLGGIDLAEDSGENTENDDDSLISQDDIDALLGGSDATDIPEDDGDAGESGVSLISQEDIDSLLNGAGSDNETEEEKPVTQDDIDNLLAADEEAVVEDVRSETGEKLVSQDDIDKLLNADIDDDDLGDYDEAMDAGADQVILEKGDEEDNDSGKKRLATKIIIGCIVGFVLIIAVGVSIVVFSGSPEDEVVEMEVRDDGQDEVVADLEEEMLEIEELPDTAFVIVELKDFVVPAPLTMKDISYISLDLTLEIVDVTSNPIKGYEPFFRNIIYEVLNKALELQSESRIIEADLVRMIKNALNDALSEGSVNKVSFLKFNMT